MEDRIWKDLAWLKGAVGDGWRRLKQSMRFDRDVHYLPVLDREVVVPVRLQLAGLA